MEVLDSNTLKAVSTTIRLCREEGFKVRIFATRDHYTALFPPPPPPTGFPRPLVGTVPEGGLMGSPPWPHHTLLQLCISPIRFLSVSFILLFGLYALQGLHGSENRQHTEACRC